MRKYMILGIAFMFLALSGIENANAQLIQIDSSFSFGRPKNGCTGFGICWFMSVQMNFTWGNYNRNVEAVRGKTSLNDSNKTFIITFSVSELKGKDPKKYEEMLKGKFYLDEDIALPNEANGAYRTKITTPIILKAGIYDVNIKGDTATIEVGIK